MDLWDTYGPLAATGLALAAGLVVVGVAYRVVRRGGRRVPALDRVAGRTHKPVQLLVALLMARFAVVASTDEGAWREPLLHGLLVAAIGAGGWLVASLLTMAAGTATTRLGLDEAVNPQDRRARTQVLVLRRLTVAVVTVVSIGAALYTFPAMRGLGTSLLASAGLLGVVAGLAAQSTLGNMIAGMQIAFGNRLRLDDIVVVEGEWGRVEEITLSYVVVRIWDQRRLLMPTSYFTTTPFVSWTRNDTEVLGTVELDVDWTVPVPQLREELERFVQQHPLWDGRVVSLVVLDATGSTVRVRPLVSAADADNIWSLRCAVREHLVEWIRAHYPDAIPRVRAELTSPDSVPVPAQSRSTLATDPTRAVPAGSPPSHLTPGPGSG